MKKLKKKDRARSLRLSEEQKSQKMITRRTFLKKAVKGTGATFAAPYFMKNLFSKETAVDLTAVSGGEPADLLHAGLKPFGGIRSFGIQNKTVCIKPNIGWAQTPEYASNTNPDLIRALVTYVKDAGAKKIYIFDHTCNHWKSCYEDSGIEKAVRESGGEMMKAHEEKDYHEVKITGTQTLDKVKVHKVYAESDFVINVPVLKKHGGAELSIALKNLMGVVWNRRRYHFSGLHDCIADFPLFRKPDLNIIDAYRILKKRGPRAKTVNDSVKARAIIISRDIVAADSAGAKLFGMEPEGVPHIIKARKHNLGYTDLSKLNIKKIKL